MCFKPLKILFCYIQKLVLNLTFFCFASPETLFWTSQKLVFRQVSPGPGSNGSKTLVERAQNTRRVNPHPPLTTIRALRRAESCIACCGVLRDSVGFLLCRAGLRCVRVPTNLLNDLFVGLLWVVCCVSGPPNAVDLAAHCVATIQNHLKKTSNPKK